MRKILILSFILYCVSGLSAQTSESTSSKEQSIELNTKNQIKSKGLHFFNIYFEWNSGDFLRPVSQRIVREEFDIKAAYLHTFAAVPWLSLGLSSQFKTSPKWNSQNLSLGKTLEPDSFVMSANILFGRIFDIAFGSDGTLTASLFYSQDFPQAAGLKSHKFIAFMKNVFFLRGNAYNSNNVLTQGWWDSTELRLQYQMKFNDYVGLRPEIVLAVLGTGLLNGGSFLTNFMMRLNPRLYMYAPGGWSFFVEPRVFLLDWTRGDNPAVELKFGIDYTALWQ